jgi:hypothetical protein
MRDSDRTAITWVGRSGVVTRSRVPVATLGHWSIAVRSANGSGAVGIVTAPVLTGAEALEPRDGWTLELLAGNGILWRWSKATRVDAWTWRVVGDPEWEEAST